MASFLYRLGRFSFRRRWLVVGLWLLVLVGVATSAATLSGKTSEAFSIPGTPSQKVIDLLKDRFPQAKADGATARVVFAAPKGQKLTDAGPKAAIAKAVAELKKAPQVASVSDPIATGAVNPAGTVGFAQATYTVASADLTDQAKDSLDQIVAQARGSGLTVEVGGDVMQLKAEQGGGEVVGIAIAAVILFITFGSFVAAGLPLLTAILGIVIGVSAITAATGFIDMSSTTSTLALMVGLAVAIDYALFIVSRYRSELAAGRDREEAAGRAVGTAGSAVVFAGLTVIIALAALFVTGIPFITQMGLAAAGTVAVAVAIALTLLPALLGISGKRITGGKPREARGSHVRNRHPEGPEGTIGGRRATAISRRPVLALLIAVLALGTIALPALDLKLGMPDDSTAAPDTTQRKAYDLIADGFGPGFNAPLTVAIDTASGNAKAAATEASTLIRALPDVATVTTAVLNQAGDTAVVTVIPKSGPSSSETKDLVRAIRDLDGKVPDTTIGVTGLTAVNIDVSTKLGDALVPYLAVVVGLAFVLLMLVFRSILVPITAAIGFLLSVAATFGAVVAVFQWGWLANLLGIQQTGPIISLLPILLVGIVFGLAMDYQVFLVTRMREDFVHGNTAGDAMISGFGHGARVVTAAAFIMISVFSGFILSSESIVKSIGFALGVAVLFDAVVVRMTFIPAVMALLGKAAWWMPAWLDRILPNVDVEGEKLRHQLDDPAPAPVLDPTEPVSAS